MKILRLSLYFNIMKMSRGKPIGWVKVEFVKTLENNLQVMYPKFFGAT